MRKQQTRYKIRTLVLVSGERFPVLLERAKGLHTFVR